MRRMAVVLAALFAVAPGQELSAQFASRDAAAASFAPVNLPDGLFDQEFDQEEGPSVLRRVATAAGGAVLGAGLGFFASQVFQGDWEAQQARTRPDRTAWAIVGGSVGAGIGMAFPISWGSAGSSGSGGFPSGRRHIPSTDLAGRGFNDAYQAVQTLRPEWMRIRGNQTFTGGNEPVVVSGTGSIQVSGTPTPSEASLIQVYVDGQNIGGIESLRSVDVLLVRDMYFFNQAQATLRWGGSNPHGAILIVT